MNTVIDKRGYESAKVGSETQAVRTSDFTVVKTAFDGYQTNGWVRRCLEIISGQVSAPPWIVVRDGKEIPNHPAAATINYPHPQLTKTQVFQTIVNWLELTGTAPINFVKGGKNGTMQMNLIAPDRLKANIANSGLNIYTGFEIDEKGSGSFKSNASVTIENTIIPRYVNPAALGKGIGTLISAGLAVDQDNAQSKWNVALMNNRGRVSDVFTTDRDLTTEQGETITEKLFEKIRGMANRMVGKPLVLGSNLQYTRMGLTPVEIDFINSRKFNREEIFCIFGVPVQLGGSEQSATYSNFTAAVRVLWEMKIFDVLNTIRDEINLHFLNVGFLKQGEFLTYDTSRITALRDDEDAKANIAKKYFDMGIPVSQINDKLNLGFTEYNEWDVPNVGVNIKQQKVQERYFSLTDIKYRSVDDEFKQLADMSDAILLPSFTRALSDQESIVFDLLDKNKLSKKDIEDGVKTVTNNDLHDVIRSGAVEIGEMFADKILTRTSGVNIQTRKVELELTQAIETLISKESAILREFSFINATTVNAIMEQVQDFVENNKTIEQLKQAIQDTGALTPERALRISRTIGANAGSIGQIAGANEAGATTKTWNATGSARSIHSSRNGETVSMTSRFSLQVGSIAPRYPADSDIAVEDRVNCRCFMTFSD